ncbi:MAG: hypothetical protein Q4E74_11035 [Ruminococcus sp.]|nr:hypothetical protein [Ruminococcus sp.]
MRNITELLQEIPLNELMGDVTMTDKEINKTIENAENKIAQEKRGELKSDKPARVRRKMPLAVAAAAFALVIGGGYVLSDIASGGENDISPAAQESQDTEKDIQPEDVNENLLAENTAYLRKSYEEWGRSFDNGKDYIRVFDKQVGEITSGFDNLEIRVLGTVCCYPYYSVSVMVRTLDGSEIGGGNSSGAKAEWSLSRSDGMSLGFYSGGMDNYGDCLIGTIRMNYESNNGEFNNNMDFVLEISQITLDDDTSLSGSFKGEFPAGDMLYKDKFLEVDQTGKWECSDGYELEYNLESISYSDCGLELSMDITSRESDTITYSEAINPYWRSVKRWTGPELWDTIEGFEPDFDYDFVKVRYEDGTSEALDFGDFDLIRDEGTGLFKAYFSLLSSPMNSDEITGFTIGSVEVDL